MSCNDCEDLQPLCTDECIEKIASKCVYYDGEDIVSGDINIQTNDDLTKVINELVKNALDLDIDLSFNPTTRQLCLLKNGVTVKCKTIPDGDDQYLTLTGTLLKIWKPGATPVQIGAAIDLAELLGDTTLNIISQSIQVIPGGTNGHSPRLNIVPSSDLGNIFKMGSDGKPYVPASAQGITDVVITDVEGVTWAKTYSNGVLTFTPTFNWTTIAAIICPICADACAAPGGIIVTPGG